MNSSHDIILASGSPRRRQLLEWAEIGFDIITRDTPETWPPGMPIPDVPVHIARNKALAVQQVAGPEKLIIAADTVVVLNDEIIGKPKDRADAIGILTRLVGKKHEVITGVALLKAGAGLTFADTTAVWFHELTGAEIEGYVDRYHPFDKAGAYAIQEWIGVVGIRRIEGDFYNVMGLPVSRVVRALRDF
ncbi:MAG TPA: Maf family protein [Puia sp.]|jgi:septum formation protein|nr:Maf family protein [Puia sp.]